MGGASLQAVLRGRASGRAWLQMALGGPLDEETTAWVLRGTLGALAYLHSQVPQSSLNCTT